MIEKMIEFNLSFEDYYNMFKADNLRAVRVSSMIYDALSIKKGVCLLGVKSAYERLEKKLKIYYKEYNISEIEMLKDKMFLNNLKHNVVCRSHSIIDEYFEKVERLKL